MRHKWSPIRKGRRQLLSRLDHLPCLRATPGKAHLCYPRKVVHYDLKSELRKIRSTVITEEIYRVIFPLSHLLSSVAEDIFIVKGLDCIQTQVESLVWPLFRHQYVVQRASDSISIESKRKNIKRMEEI